VQVDPIRPKLKPPETKHLNLNYDVLLSTSAFKFNMRCYTEGGITISSTPTRDVSLDVIRAPRALEGGTRRGRGGNNRAAHNSLYSMTPGDATWEQALTAV